jgi:hypothetical protein
MQQLNLVALNNSSFVLTLDLSQIAAIYGSLSTIGVRMQIKAKTTDPVALAEFSIGGAIFAATVNAVGNTVQFTAAQTAVATLLGDYVFDVRLELPGLGERVAAFGIVEFFNGVTQSTVATNLAVGAGLGDTVFVVFSKIINTPTVFPFSIAQMQDAATRAAASAAAAAASLTATTNAGTTALAAVAAAGAGYSNTVLTTWLVGLPTTLPGTAGLWWIDNGVLSLS